MDNLWKVIQQTCLIGVVFANILLLLLILIPTSRLRNFLLRFIGVILLALSGFMVLYIILPVDLLPEAILGVIGLIDDSIVAVLTSVLFGIGIFLLFPISDIPNKMLLKEDKPDNVQGLQRKSIDPEVSMKLSVAYPRVLSKRFESTFLIHIYLPQKRDQVTRNIKSEFKEQTINELIQTSSMKIRQKIKLRLFSPAFDFPDAVIKVISGAISKVTLLGMPKDNCEPGAHKVLVSISDAETDREFESFAVNVRVVDFAFDHVSRPLLARVSAFVLGTGSLVVFILTLLEQIDKTIGLTSGTAAGVLAAVVYANFYNLYQRIRPTTP